MFTLWDVLRCEKLEASIIRAVSGICVRNSSLPAGSLSVGPSINVLRDALLLECAARRGGIQPESESADALFVRVCADVRIGMRGGHERKANFDVI